MKKSIAIITILIAANFLTLSAQTCASCPVCFTAGAELVTNGTFAFSAPYAYTATLPLVNAIYTATPPVAFGNYSITSNPNTYNGSWCGTDHTGGGTMMLICDGFNGSPTSAWGQYINISTIAPNTNYTFCFYAMNIVCPGNFTIDPLIQMYVDGVPLLTSPYTLVENNNQWVLITGTWNSGAAPPATVLLEIATMSYSGSGNDFAIDDISFKACLPSFTVTTSSDTSVCAGKSVQLSAAGATNYAWTPAAGLSSTSVSNPACNALVTTTYTVSVSDNFGCTKTQSITVTVNALPVVSLGSDTSLCDGTPFALSAGNFSSYLWNNGNTSSSLTINSSGNYTVTVTDNKGCTKSDSVVVTFNPVPVFSASPAVDSSCAGTAATLGVTNLSYVYAWTPSAGLSATTGSTVLATPINSTTYTVTGFNGFGCTATSTVSLTINPLPPASGGPNKTICKKDSIVLNGSGGTVYSWLPAPSLSNPAINNPKASPLATTTYTVTVTDANACSATATVKVKVNALPAVNLGADTLLCNNGQLLLNGNSNNANTFMWQNGSTTMNFLASDSGTYYVMVTDSNGCKGADTIKINYFPTANLVLTALDTQLCVGDTVQASASGGVTYSWAPAAGISTTAGASILIFPDTTTSYILTAMDSNSCVVNDSLTIIVFPLPQVVAGNDTAACVGTAINMLATGGVSYSWFPSTGLSSSSLANPVATPLTTTIYTVVATDTNTCVNSDSMQVTIFPLPVINLGNDTTLCTVQQITLSTPGVFNSYLWQNGNTNATLVVTSPATYILTVTDTNGCAGYDSVNVNFVFCPPPVITFGCSDTAFCEKQCIDFYDLSANNPSSWLWLFPGANPDTSTAQNPTGICYNSYGAFDVELIACNAGGCDTALFPLFIHEFQTPPAPVIYQSFDTLICTATNVTYAWYNTNNPNTVLSTNYYYIPTVAGNYYVLISDSNGCAVASNIAGSNTAVPQVYGNAGITIVDNGNIATIESEGINISAVRIYDATGKAVAKINYKSPTRHADIYMPQSTGIYFIEITSSVGMTVHFKIFHSKAE